MDAVTAIILAAGEGKRMRSRQPKILHRLCGRPLVGYPLRLARTFADRVVMVVPPSADGVAQVAGEGVLTVVQRERLGTGHAVVQAKDARSEEHTSELQSRGHLVCRLLLEKKKAVISLFR